MEPHKGNEPLVAPLEDAAALGAGGKAKGLHLLLQSGARVPDGFAIRDARHPRLAEVLRAFMTGRFDPEGSTFAVRSSGMDEDGGSASFAGQYETILNVRGFDAIRAAIRACLDSASSIRVREYAARREKKTDAGFPIIVQKMVDARFAGVVFTADPVNNRRDRILIDAVAGLGEELVGGRSSGEHHALSRRGREISYSGRLTERLLPPRLLNEIREEGLRIAEVCGFPADMEWAVDGNGTLYWLQLRPITTLSPVHFNELDYTPPDAGRHLLTRCNVGEMMPGPVTPLTWSVFGRGIDVGMQEYLVRMHVLDRVGEENRFIFMFYNHLFIDMTMLYEIPRKVAFTVKTDVDKSICGRPVDGPEPVPSRSFPVRLMNFFRYVMYFMEAGSRLKALKRLERSFALPLEPDSLSMYGAINAALPVVFAAWSHHYATSGKSGALNSAILRVLESDGAGTARDHLGALTGLLSNLGGGIDGAAALMDLEGIRKAIRSDSRVLDTFLRQPADACLAFLAAQDSGQAGLLFSRFMRRHGHRCIREAELRERDWSSDPAALIRMLKADAARDGGAAGSSASAGGERGIDGLLSLYSGKTRAIIKRVLPAARKSVVARENSKSLCILIQSRFKKAYVHLGRLLASRGLLDDADEVFFLTHRELGRLVEEGGEWARGTAMARRELFPSFFDLTFEDFSRGAPEPVETRSSAVKCKSGLQGIPVSAGTVTGKARVIHSFSDAEMLAPGEIMIASYTDIGWTPYFSRLSGLVTEIGSMLSHGAVVAREYGIPAVVGVRGAKNLIRTGDTITMDGRKGTVEVH